MASVKVAVRVRPLNKREIDLESKVIIHMEGKKTQITNAKIPESSQEGDFGRERIKDFTFDFSYNSLDPSNVHFASQEQVYQDLGSDVVTSAFEGYNACVFAYGQTGSGKTYTMMGSSGAIGLIPRICQTLFSRMKANRNNNITYRTEVSYLEIYNECVRDLLRKDHTQHNLKVRQHPKEGPYVADLSKHLVMEYNDIEELMNQGNTNRTTASTNMNDVSSRSHAIFTITFSQAKFNRDMPSEIVSKVNLVDLAGSERADATGATGQRLKEGASINKSLVTLGNVISALADLSSHSNKNKQIFIPYRDSVLTWLLKDSLGGNAKTIMVAAISPADINYAETLSTLRYANRAKNIINKPTINEDGNVKLIRELKAEITRLRFKLAGSNNKMTSPQVIEKIHETEARVKILTDEWTEKWKETFRILEEQKTLGLRQFGTGIILDSELPHLIGIDDNLLSTGMTLYHLKEGRTTIGQDSSVLQDIVLSGLDIEEEHCIIENVNGNVTLIPINNALCVVNGTREDQPTPLYQGYIIVLGQNNMFRFNDPIEAAKMRQEGGKSSLNLSRLSLLSQSMSDITKSVENLHNCSGLELEKKHEEDLRLLEMKRNQIKELEELHLKAEEKRNLLHQQKEQELEEKRQKLDKICQENELLKKQAEDVQKSIEKEHKKLNRRSMDIEKQLQDYIIEKGKFDEEKQQEREKLMAKERQLEKEKDEMQVTIEAEMKRLAEIVNRQKLANELAQQAFTQELENLKKHHEEQLKSLNVSYQLLIEKENEQKRIIESKEKEILQQRKQLQEERQRNLELIERENKELLELKRELDIARKLAKENNLVKEQNENRLQKTAEDLHIKQLEFKEQFDIAHRELEKWRELTRDEILSEKTSLNKRYSDLEEKEKYLNYRKENNLVSPEDLEKEQEFLNSERKKLELAEITLNNREKIAQEKYEADSKSLHEQHREDMAVLETEEKHCINSENHNIQNIEQLIHYKNKTLQERQEQLKKDDYLLSELTETYEYSVSQIKKELDTIESLKNKQMADTEKALAEICQKKMELEQQTEEEISKIEKQRSRLMEWKNESTEEVAGDDPEKQELRKKLKNLKFLEEQYLQRIKELEEEKIRLEQERIQEVDQIENEKLKLQELEEEKRINALVEKEVKRRLLEKKTEAEKLQKIQQEQEKKQKEQEIKKIQDDHKRQLQRLKEEYQARDHKMSKRNQFCSTPNLSENHEGEVPQKHLERYFSVHSLDHEPIHITIPKYILRGAGSNTHYEYEIKISVFHESWTIYRRYKRFRELHMFMKKKYKEVALINFPPRKLFNRSERVVSQRRPQLEEYLRKLIETCMKIKDCPLCVENEQSLSKNLLCEVAQFFQKGMFETTKFETS